MRVNLERKVRQGIGSGTMEDRLWLNWNCRSFNFSLSIPLADRKEATGARNRSTYRTLHLVQQLGFNE